MFEDGYFKGLYHWFESGGDNHVAAYLAKLDISAFDAKAPPPQTPAFWAIADAGCAPEDAELADALDALGRPAAVILDQIGEVAEDGFKIWLGDRKNSRQIPYRMEACGYVQVRRMGGDGRWVMAGKRRVVYALSTLSAQAQQEAAKTLVGKGESNIFRPGFGQHRRYSPKRD
jgi:hypothetical protein